MKEKFDHYLVAKYPYLFIDRHASMKVTAMCWGFECGDGWFKLLDKLCAKLEKLVIQAIADDPQGWNDGFYRAAQVKEKFGALRFYMSGQTDKMAKIISQAELKSTRICEICGKRGQTNNDGWISTLCKKHRKEQE